MLDLSTWSRRRRGHRRLVLLAAPLVLLGAVAAFLTAGNGASAVLSTGTAAEVSLWPADTTPVQGADPDRDPVELGTRFRAAVPGTVTGIRYFRFPANAGPHVGHLWDDTGRLLATVPFSVEAASGWQLARLSTPVALEAGRTYVVSYHAPAGRYADDQYYFARRLLRSGPLTADAGVYAYGTQARFPTQRWRASSYYVDVTFRPTGQAEPPPVGPISPTATPTTPPPVTTPPATTPPVTTPAPPTTPPVTTPPPVSGSCAFPTCFPTAATTGVPAGTALTTVNGDLKVTTDGAQIDARDIRGDLIVLADNVKVTRTRVQGVVFAHTSDQRGLTMVDSEITANPGQSYSVGNQPPIGDGNYTLVRVRVHRWQDGPRAGVGTILIQDSLVDELAFASGEHPDAFQLYGPGSRVNVVLRHSTFSGCAGNSTDKGSSSIFWSDHPGAGSTFTVTENKFLCGQFSVRINDANRGSGVIADVHDNVVVRGSYAHGPVECNNSIPFSGLEGIKWARNTFDDGAVIGLPSC